MKGKKKIKSIKQKIIFYVMSVAVILGVCTCSIMVFSCFKLTDYVLKDNLQMMAKASAKNISANLHLLTDRILALSLEKDLKDEEKSNEEKLKILEERKTRIEFVWLAVYDLNGKKIYGDADSPDAIDNQEYFKIIAQTNNTVIGDPYSENNLLQLAVGTTLKSSNKPYAYLFGSYKYDLLNDVLSEISFGKTGGAYIVNKEGIIIADKDISNMTKGISIFDEYNSGENHAIFNNILDDQTDSTTIKLNNIEHYMAYSPVGGANWNLIVDAPKQEFLGMVKVGVTASVVLSIFILFVAGSIIYHLAHKISKSLFMATQRLEALSNGNLKDEVVIFETGDEVEELTISLSTTIHNLKIYIDNIKSSLGAFSEGDYTHEISKEFVGDFSEIRNALLVISDSLNKTMRQVNTASIEISDESSVISDYARKLYSGSLQQADTLTSLKESLDLVIDKSNQIDSNSKQVTSRANETTLKVLEGNNQMSFMLSTMNMISENMREIAKIGKMMEKISSQTKILSLNASVEASRAGEAGKSFAVVAGEIGNLSAQTTMALKQTSQIVQLANHSINEGMRLAENAAESLSAINTATSEFSSISNSLLRIVGEQKAAISQIEAEVNSVQEVASTNQNLAKLTDDKTEEFLVQSKHLEEFVSQVKLKEEGSRL